MSTIQTTNLKHESSGSNNIVLDSSGNIAVQAGTVSAPAIQATGDSNTGIYFPAADTIAFTEGGNEAVRIDSSSRLLVGTSSATANGGVLQVSNGITFPATQSACSDANTLDDYEEGSWTPKIFIGSGTTEVTSYAVQTGRYRKIGDMVVAMCNVGTDGNKTGGNTGSLFVGGLPFTSATINIATTVHAEGLDNLTTQSIMFQLDSGQTKVILRSFTSGTISALTHSNINVAAVYKGFNFVVTYLSS